MRLFKGHTAVGTIFDLLGDDENDMTFALGFVLARSEAFATLVLAQALGQPPGDLSKAVVRLQTTDPITRGRTDLEVTSGKRFGVIFEAKRGPVLPSRTQLEKYASHLRDDRFAVRKLVAVTTATDDYAAFALRKGAAGIDVVHLSWRAVHAFAERAAASEPRRRNKRLLHELATYLKGILGMETKRSNMVFVVSLGGGGAWGVDFHAAVRDHGRYFFPTEGRWPDPPNYVAFRFGGKLQSIHHVDGYEVMTNPRRYFDQAEDVEITPHYILKLGPAIVPPREVKTGPGIVMATRVWCMLDTLLTSPTITEALRVTKERLRDAQDLDDLEVHAPEELGAGSADA